MALPHPHLKQCLHWYIRQAATGAPLPFRGNVCCRFGSLPAPNAWFFSVCLETVSPFLMQCLRQSSELCTIHSIRTYMYLYYVHYYVYQCIPNIVCTPLPPSLPPSQYSSFSPLTSHPVTPLTPTHHHTLTPSHPHRSISSRSSSRLTIRKTKSFDANSHLDSPRHSLRGTSPGSEEGSPDIHVCVLCLKALMNNAVRIVTYVCVCVCVCACMNVVLGHTR